MPPESLDRLAAALADRYRIVREVGAGGMATVYLAEDLRHHREVALKVLRPELAATMGPERFFREIQVAARLQHPHILPLHDSGEADGFLFYVMPFVTGESLRDRLGRLGELPVPDAVRILVQVADALSYSHSQGVVHRDIKPDNVMISGRHALVTDFGVAKAVSDAASAAKVTTAGVALGTPAYMAPEQAAADPLLDHRVDIYALGALGYELLAGRTPFTGMSPQQMLLAHVTQAPDPVSKYRDTCPPELEAIIMRCLAKKAADRWQSADELLHALEPFSVSSGGITPTQSRPASTGAGGAPGPATRIKAPVLPVLAGVAVVALAAWIGTRDRGDRDISAANLERVQLTATGRATAAALSPDGTRIAFAERTCDATGRCTLDIRVQDVGGAGSNTLLRGAIGIGDLDWSADGRWLLANGTIRDRWGAFAIPSLGGEPRYLGCCHGSFVGTSDTVLVTGLADPGAAAQTLYRVTVADVLVRDSLRLAGRRFAFHAWTIPGTGRSLLAEYSGSRGAMQLVLLDPAGAPLDSLDLASHEYVAPVVRPVERGFVLVSRTGGSPTVDLARYRLSGDERIAAEPERLAGAVPASGSVHIGRNGEMVVVDGAPEWNLYALERPGTGSMTFTERRIASSTVSLSGSITADGQRVLLVRQRPNDPRITELSLEPFGGGEATSLGQLEDLVDWDFHQDGRSLLVVRGRPGEPRRIGEIDLATGRLREVGTAPPDALWFETVPGGGFVHLRLNEIVVRGIRARPDTSFAWPTGVLAVETVEPAPDGSSLATVGWIGGADSIALHRVSLVDGRATRLTSTFSDGAPPVTWFADGTLLFSVVESSDSEAWYRLASTGGALTRLGFAPRPEASYRFARDGRRAIVRESAARADVFVLRGFAERLRR